MKFLLLTLSGFLCLHAVSCISGGEKADSSIPGIVLIDHYYGLRDEPEMFPPFCNGALLNSRVGITISPCCIEPTESKVYAGSHNPFSGDAQMFQIVRSRYIYEGNLERRSLCIFELDGDVEPSEKTMPVIIPNDNDKPSEHLHAFGFGSTQLNAGNKVNGSLIYHNYMSDQLMELEMPKLNRTACKKHYREGLRATCRGYVGEENHKRLMPDDQGAPLIDKKTMILYGIGVVSTHKDWNSTDNPAYFINIKEYSDEINLFVKILMK